MNNIYIIYDEYDIPHAYTKDLSSAENEKDRLMSNGKYSYIEEVRELEDFSFGKNTIEIEFYNEINEACEKFRKACRKYIYSGKHKELVMNFKRLSTVDFYEK